MAVGEQQGKITRVLEIILGEEAQTKRKFSWLKNKHDEADFGKYYPAIDKIFSGLNGDEIAMENKKTFLLQPDCYFGGTYNFIFEFDELQHFTIYKKIALLGYPGDLAYGFDLEQYMFYCDKYSNDAIRKGPPGYRKSKVEFPFENGRAAQRAFFDCFRDFLPSLHGLNKTIRISEFEVGKIEDFSTSTIKKVEKILDNKIN